jgi:hypothetical protein
MLFDLKEIEFRLDSYGSGEDPVVGSVGLGNKPSGSKKSRDVFK